MIEFICAPISVGELIDKITILEIKSERIIDPAKLGNVLAELEMLRTLRDTSLSIGPDLTDLAADLKAINEKIWAFEEVIRDRDQQQDFGTSFVEIARAVHHANDQRAAVKRKINLATGSRIIEEKSHQNLPLA
jgi:hypothetical protein